MKEKTTSTSCLSLKRVGLSLGAGITVTYVLCVAWGLVFPGLIGPHTALETVFPGFVWLTWQGFAIGLVESYLYGWYVALVFVPLYNCFSK